MEWIGKSTGRVHSPRVPKWFRSSLGRCCGRSGLLRPHRDEERREHRIELRAGEAAINPRNVWHTADIDEPCQTLFVTPGFGTEHRPR